MKKKISILIIITLILNIAINIFGNISLAAVKNVVENDKKNSESYWSTKNAPMFYGATKITLKQGIIDEFDVLDSRFRIFAKDFEDGDLTPEISYKGVEKIKVDEVGEYEITYKVTDSHNNETTLVVPVIVTDDEDAKINVERILYTIPSVWNMDLAEFSRNNYGDRQMLGIFLAENQSIKARVLSSEANISIAFLNNDSYNESQTTLPTTGEWVTLENIKEGIGYDSVPLIKSTVLSKEDTKINKNFKIELEYDETISPVDYYYYLDDEEKFREKWNRSQNSYGIIESETLIIVVPYADIPYMTNYYEKGFTSLDQFFEYYQKVVEKMDEYVGLELNPKKITDQNVRTKYLIKANRHGVGAAYYAGDHVGVNNESMRSFFEMNWGGLHELAHGYQGSLGKGEMLLGEVSNNIIGHYIQIDKNIYFHQGNWLGELKNIEEDRNSHRLTGKTFLEVDEPTRLYVIINLLNTFEGGTSYAKMFSWYREQLNLGRTMTNQDAYVESIADIYNINIIPYMEEWGLNISDSTKSNVYQKNYPLINILKDMVQDDSLKTIMKNEDIDIKYSVVTNDILEKYGIESDAKVNIEIDNFSKIKGKYILLKQGNDIIKSIEINDNVTEISNIPIGTYYLQMPIIEGYNQDYVYIQVKEDKEASITYSYKKQSDTDYNNYLKLQVLGYNYDTIAYQLTFKEGFSKAEISYPNQSAMGGNEYIKIYDGKGSLISEDVSTGGYFDYNKGTREIDMEKGYIIEVKYPNKYANKVKVYSTLTGKLLQEYNADDTITRYIIIDNGLIKEGMSEEEANELAYEQIKPTLISIIEKYNSKVSETELNNKFINFKEKAEVIDAFTKLSKEDQIPYEELINSIKKGGSPTVHAKDEKLEYKVGEEIDLYSLITAKDNEDGTILINKKNTVIDTKLNNSIPGEYDVIYKVSDSDNNITIKTIKIEIIKDETEEPDIPVEDEEEKPEEEPDIPVEDEEEKPEEEPDIPVEDEEEKPEEEPDIPVEDEEEKPEEEPDISVEDEEEKPEEEPDISVEDEEEKPEVEPDIPEEQQLLDSNSDEIETNDEEFILSEEDGELEILDEHKSIEEEVHEEGLNDSSNSEEIGNEEQKENMYMKIILIIIISVLLIICVFIINKKVKNKK